MPGPCPRCVSFARHHSHSEAGAVTLALLHAGHARCTQNWLVPVAVWPRVHTGFPGELLHHLGLTRRDWELLGLGITQTC